ncbi:MAG: MATE family efflux transporter [Capnocytophaga sp.]|nr:MATE family efflux transporter [Capnocytophaga sp.]
MPYLPHQYQEILKQFLFISSSRLLILLIPIICLSVVSENSIESVSDFSLANQFIQILIIILISINIGSNIIISRNKDNQSQTTKIIVYLFFLSLILCILFFIISKFIFSPQIHDINIILLSSMPFVAINLVFSSFLEANKKTKISLYLSILSLFITVIACALINNISVTDYAIATTLIISFVRFFQCIVTAYILNKLFSFKLHKDCLSIDGGLIKEIASFGIPEMIKSILFTGSIFLSFYYLSHYNIEIHYLSISFFYKNIISVLFLSFCIAYSIHFAKSVKIKLDKEKIIFTTVFHIIIYLFLFSTTYQAAYFFNEMYVAEISEYLYLSQLIILFDAIGLFFVFHLRINNIKILPPLLRLSFVFIGVPIGILLANKYNNSYYFLFGILSGNAIFAIMVIFYYRSLIKPTNNKT